MYINFNFINLFDFLLLTTMYANQAMAAGKFTIEAKINLKDLNSADKLKVVASANSDNQTKYLAGNELNSNTVMVSFEFNQKTDVVTVGNRDEYFVCAYDLDSETNKMKSYSCGTHK